jgi:hypothetical protein
MQPWAVGVERPENKAKETEMTTKTPQVLAAEKKVREILDLLFYDTTSLTHALVKAFRNGMPAESGIAAHEIIRDTLRKSQEAYTAAIAQPENKVAARPEVSL